MAVTPDQKKKNVLVVLLALLAMLIVYRVMSAEKPKTAPLTFPRGAVATSPVRQGLASAGEDGDPLAVLLARRSERYPGVTRDLFRMYDPAPPPPPKPAAPPPPPEPQEPEKSPEQIAAEQAQLDLSRFRFLGFLTEKDSSLFLSKDGELFIVKAGDRVMKTYRVKEAGKDYVILHDTATGAEVRVELTGGAEPAPVPPRPAAPRR